MKRKFGATLATVAIACAIVLAGLVPGLSTPVFSFAALVPLALYHVYLNGGMAFAFSPPTLSDLEVDSIYYVGFLITVTELAASAIILSRGGAGGARPVLFRFAVGLLATGYAVVARLQLQGRLPATADTGEALWPSYAERANKLLSDLELAILRVKEFGATVDRELSNGITQLESGLRDAASSSAHSFREEFGKAADAAKIALRGVNELVTDDASLKAREDLRQQLSSAALAGGKLAQTLTEIAVRGDALSIALERTTTASAPLAEQTIDLGNSLNGLTQTANGLPESLRGIRDAADSTRVAIGTAKLATDWIAPFADASVKAVPAMDGFSKALADAGLELKHVYEGLATVSASLVFTSTQLGSTGQAFKEVDADLAAMAARIGRC